jgi:protein-tyrosine phosphatase
MSFYAYSCYFYPGQGLFGKYPTPSMVEELEAAGVTVFVDLTTPQENLPGYTPKSAHYLAYPMDRHGRVPELTSFREFLATLINYLHDPTEIIYLHCKGGHERSSLVVACLLKTYLGISSAEAIKRTSAAHQHRKHMNPKVKRIGFPRKPVMGKS